MWFSNWGPRIIVNADLQFRHHMDASYIDSMFTKQYFGYVNCA